jgi:carbonic anhydrase
MALTAGAAFMLWPKTPDPAAAKRAKAAVHQAAAASAPLPAALNQTAAAAASAAAIAPSGPATVDARASDSTASAAGAAAAGAAVAATDEAPIDQLRRRLGQVLNGKGELDAVASGDLRLRTRSAVDARMLAVKHVEPDQGDGGHGKPSAVARARIAARPTGHAAAHWSYDGHSGPQAWARLKAEFATCASGQRQSPIDIRDGIGLDLEPLQFDYRPSSFGVIDNGHTVQVNVAPGNAIELQGRRFELQQFHFHRPSEERIDGRQFEMGVHLVHRDAQGRLAVVAVLLERGAAQPLLQTVWNHLPLEKNEEAPARVLLDLTQLLPPKQGYFTYMGSLTTPPCSEGVLWLVMQQPVPVSGAQIDIFSRLYPMNARPIQQAAGRMIKQSN